MEISNVGRVFTNETKQTNLQTSRVFYCVNGKGKIVLGKKEHRLQKGTFVALQKTEYSLLCTQPIEFLQVDFECCDDSFGLPPVACLQNMQLCEADFYNMQKEWHEKPQFYKQKITALLTRVLIDVSRQINTPAKTLKNRKVDKILKYIHSHYSEEITNTVLGEKFGCHPNYINSLVSKDTGMSLHKYVLRLRIDKAIELLTNTDMTAAAISERVGFYDYNHFLKYFKQITGKTTKDFR